MPLRRYKDIGVRHSIIHDDTFIDATRVRRLIHQLFRDVNRAPLDFSPYNLPFINQDKMTLSAFHDERAEVAMAHRHLPRRRYSGP